MTTKPPIISSANVTPPIRPKMPWRVVEVQPLDGFCLYVRFVDGMEGIVDMSELVHSSAAGVFAKLADPLCFAQVFVDLGAVTWPGEIDLAPDTMYDEIKQNGKWVISHTDCGNKTRKEIPDD